MRGLTLAMVAGLAAAAACSSENKREEDERSEALPRIEKSLTLTNPALFLAEEAGGGFTFEQMVANLLPVTSSASDRSDLVKAWLVDWAARRPGVREKILCPWLEASTGELLCRDGDLDLAIAPFKPVAIVNRMDLHDPEHCEDAGELRVAFAWVDEMRKEQPLMLVFEYAVPTHNLPVAEWAARWMDLENMPCTSEECWSYRGAVEGLVSAVTEAPFGEGDDVEPTIKPSVEDEDSGRPTLELNKRVKRQARVLSRSTLRHVRIHDRALGATDFREYDLASMGSSSRLVATETPATGKCQGCHTGSGPSGERFNLNPGVEASGRMHPDILEMMPVRVERLPELERSECEPLGGEVRNVPW